MSLMISPVNEAYEQLVTLSPFEIKDLLHHILSSREFMVNAGMRIKQLYNIGCTWVVYEIYCIQLAWILNESKMSSILHASWMHTIWHVSHIQRKKANIIIITLTTSRKRPLLGHGEDGSHTATLCWWY